MKIIRMQFVYLSLNIKKDTGIKLVKGKEVYAIQV